MATRKCMSLSALFGFGVGVGSGVGVGTGADGGGFTCLLPDCAFAVRQPNATSRATTTTPNTVAVGLTLISLCFEERRTRLFKLKSDGQL